MFEIEIEPLDLEKSLTADVRDISKSIVKELVELAPVEMRDLMGTSPSPKGAPPGVKTGSLARSIQSFGDDSIRMNDYAQYLDDSLFDGYLNRPFIVPAIDNALVKIAKTL